MDGQAQQHEHQPSGGGYPPAAPPPSLPLLPPRSSRISSRPAVATSTRATTRTAGLRWERGLPGGLPFETACSNGCPGRIGASIRRWGNPENVAVRRRCTRKPRSGHSAQSRDA